MVIGRCPPVCLDPAVEGLFLSITKVENPSLEGLTIRFLESGLYLPGLHGKHTQ